MLGKQALSDLLISWPRTGEDPASCEQILDKPVFLLTTKQGEKLVLKAVGRRSQAQRFEALYPLWQYLHAWGLRVAVPFLSINGTCTVAYHEEFYTLSPYLSGMRATSAPNQSTYTLIGRALAHLHQALATYPDALPAFWQMNLIPQGFELAVAHLLAYSPPAEARRLASIIATIEPGIQATCTHLPAHLLHGDCNGSNFLIDDQSVAILDLAQVPTGPRLYDLAFFLLDQVKWSTEDGRHTATWFSHVPAFLFGYKQVNPLARQEQEAIFPMMQAVHLFYADRLLQKQLTRLVDLHLAAFFWLYEHQEAIVRSITQR